MASHSLILLEGSSHGIGWDMNPLFFDGVDSLIQVSWEGNILLDAAFIPTSVGGDGMDGVEGVSGREFEKRKKVLQDRKFRKKPRGGKW
jgi:hypothetical protein